MEGRALRAIKSSLSLKKLLLYLTKMLYTHTLLSYDGANAFNSIYIPPKVAASASENRSLSGPLRIKLLSYSREPPKLLFALDGGGLEVVEPARGVHLRMKSRSFLLQRRLPQDPKRVQGQPTGARSESGFVHRRHHGHSTNGLFPRYGSHREKYGMTVGTLGGKKHLVEPKEIAGSASKWSWARTSDGRAASGSG